MVIEALLGAAAEVVVEASWDWIRRREETQRILREFGVDFKPASADFDDVYRYTLVLFAIGKPKAISELFHQELVKQSLYHAFETGNRTVLERDAREVIEWPTVEKLLEEYEIRPEPLLNEFLDCFEATVKHIRTTIDIRYERKLDAIYDDITQVPQETAKQLLTLLEERFAFPSALSLLADTANSPGGLDAKIYSVQLDQARDLLQEEKAGAALTLLRKLESEFREKDIPTSLQFRVTTNIGASLLQLGEQEEAAEYLERALAFDPENPIAISNVAYIRLVHDEFEEAINLARRALELKPDHPTTLATLIEALGRTNQFDTLDNASRVAAEAHPVSRRALAGVFINKGQYKAAEALLRTSIESETCEIQDLVLLAQSILAPVQNRQHEEPRFWWAFSEQERKALLEAESLLDDAIEAWRTIENRSRLHNVLMVRLNARALQSKTELAIQDAERILAEEPEYWPAVYARAMLAMENGNFVQAEQLLEQHISAQPESGRLSLALAYLQNDKPEAVLQLLLGEEWQVEERSLDFQLERLTLIAEAAHKLNKIELLNEINEQLEAFPETDVLVLEAKSSMSLLLGNIEDTIHQFTKARENAQGVVRERLTLRLADVHFRQQHFTEAASLYAEIVPDKEDTPPTRNYLVSLLNSGDWQKAYELANAIRANGAAIPIISEVEARVAEYIGDTERALDLYTQLAELEPHNWEHFLRLATVQVRQGNIDEAASILERVIGRFQDEPEALIGIAKVFATAKRPASDTLSLAYRARRLGFNDPEIHLAYIGLFLALERDTSLNLSPETVGVGTSVHLTSEDEDIWVTILNEQPVDREKREFHFSDSVAEKLLGRALNETVDLKEGPLEERIYIVDEIQSKFVRALQETFMNFGSWFPDHPGLHRFKIIDDDLSPIFKVSSMRFSLVRQMRELYDSQKLTLEGFAQAVGRSIADAWSGVRGQDGSLLASTGTADERRYHAKLLESATESTVDLTALFTLSFLDRIEILRQQFDTVYISQAALDVLTEELGRLQRFQRDYAVIGQKDDRYTFERIPREQIEHNRRILERILEFVRGNLTIRPANAALELELPLFKRMETVLGQSSVAAVLVAKETKSVLYSDDLPLRVLARRHFQVEGVWSQPILSTALNRSIISDVEYFDAVSLLARMDYFYVSLDASILVHVLAKNNWSINSDVEQTMKPLRDRKTTTASALNVCSEIVIHSCLHSLTPFQRSQILHLTLRTLVAERGTNILHALRRQVIDDIPSSISHLLPTVLQEIELWAQVHQSLGTYRNGE